MWGEFALSKVPDLLFSISSWVRRKFTERHFRQIFGDGVGREGFALIYEELELRHQSESHPYKKPEGDDKMGFSTFRPVPINQVRSINYLAGVIGNSVGKTPVLRSDIETKSLLNIDFVSFGGPGSNFKTADCHSNSGNCLAFFDQVKHRFVRKSDGETLVQFEQEMEFDYGMILKVCPSQFPQRVWIACAGFGEWGTSGAAWFLANKWEEIRRKANQKPFAAIVRVRVGQDQSAELVRVLN